MVNAGAEVRARDRNIIASTTDTAGVGTFTTTETVVLSVTAALENGVTYQVRARGLTESTVAADQVRARLREDDVTGTVFDLQNIYIGTASNVVRFYAEGEYTAAADGDKTFVLTLVRNSGTGSVRLTAAATYPARLTVRRDS